MFSSARSVISRINGYEPGFLVKHLVLNRKIVENKQIAFKVLE